MTKVYEWFGYKLHLLVDVVHEVIVAYLVTAQPAPPSVPGHGTSRAGGEAKTVGAGRFSWYNARAMVVLRNPIPLPLGDLVPAPSLFAHRSQIHGQQHVSRVLIHAFLLLDRIGKEGEAVALWAAVYLHDLSRTHDGICHTHGEGAAARLEDLPEAQALFRRGGVPDDAYPAIRTAVTHHSRPEELPLDHQHRRITALLKDADGLDRVRLGDLDVGYLRFPESRRLASFAERLYRETQDAWPVGDGYFERAWAAAERLLTEQ